MITLIVAIILCGLFYINFTKQVPTVDQSTQQVISGAGIDNTSYETTLNSVLGQIKNLEKMQAERVEGYTKFPSDSIK